MDIYFEVVLHLLFISQERKLSTKKRKIFPRDSFKKEDCHISFQVMESKGYKLSYTVEIWVFLILSGVSSLSCSRATSVFPAGSSAFSILFCYWLLCSFSLAGDLLHSGVNILRFGILFLFSWCLFPGLPWVNLGNEVEEVLNFLGARGWPALSVHTQLCPTAASWHRIEITWVPAVI